MQYQQSRLNFEKEEMQPSASLYITGRSILCKQWRETSGVLQSPQCLSTTALLLPRQGSRAGHTRWHRDLPSLLTGARAAGWECSCSQENQALQEPCRHYHQQHGWDHICSGVSWNPLLWGLLQKHNFKVSPVRYINIKLHARTKDTSDECDEVWTKAHIDLMIFEVLSNPNDSMTWKYWVFFSSPVSLYSDKGHYLYLQTVMATSI